MEYTGDMTKDHVDEILEQWAREMPGLDTSPMGVVGRVSRLARVLEKGLSQTFSASGLNGGEFDVLATLRRSGSPYALTPKRLSEAAMLSSGAMTNRIDHLEKAGLIARRPDPDDRRGTLVRLTAEGKDLVNRVVAEHVENERKLLDSLDANDLDTLSSLLRKLLLPFDVGDKQPSTIEALPESPSGFGQG